jgi:hypothetical protein
MHGTVFIFDINQSNIYFNFDEMFAVILIWGCHLWKKVMNAKCVWCSRPVRTSLFFKCVLCNSEYFIGLDVHLFQKQMRCYKAKRPALTREQWPHRVSQEEGSIFWEVIVSVILSKTYICTCVLFGTVFETEIFHYTIPKLLIRKRYYVLFLMPVFIVQVTKLVQFT